MGREIKEPENMGRKTAPGVEQSVRRESQIEGQICQSHMDVAEQHQDECSHEPVFFRTICMIDIHTQIQNIEEGQKDDTVCIDENRQQRHGQEYTAISCKDIAASRKAIAASKIYTVAVLHDTE